MEKGNMRRIKRALISVSDKSGVVDFTKALAEMRVEILSTGGTAGRYWPKQISACQEGLSNDGRVRWGDIELSEHRGRGGLNRVINC